MVSSDRFKNLLKRMGCQFDPDYQFNRLVTAYSQKHRAYHNINHIEHCLELFDQVSCFLNYPDLVEVAIWYHDAVYNTRSSRNEEESALLANQDLSQLGIERESIRMISDLILATKHHAHEPETLDAKYMIDIDLSILGAPPEIFNEYETNVRKEYHWVPAWLFKKKRREVLRSFIKRNPIFYTQWFYDRFEHQAWENLASVVPA